jgi:hypothetical protein
MILQYFHRYVTSVAGTAQPTIRSTVITYMPLGLTFKNSKLCPESQVMFVWI